MAELIAKSILIVVTVAAVIYLVMYLKFVFNLWFNGEATTRLKKIGRFH